MEKKNRNFRMVTNMGEISHVHIDDRKCPNITRHYHRVTESSDSRIKAFINRNVVKADLYWETPLKIEYLAEWIKYYPERF